MFTNDASIMHATFIGVWYTQMNLRCQDDEDIYQKWDK